MLLDSIVKLHDKIQNMKLGADRDKQITELEQARLRRLPLVPSLQGPVPGTTVPGTTVPGTTGPGSTAPASTGAATGADGASAAGDAAPEGTVTSQ
jgi:hypothetical protein